MDRRFSGVLGICVTEPLWWRARTRLSAPLDGLVVSGDLSQSLGAPLERGDVLFEVGPLDGYRIMLEVDEREVAQVRPGQQGDLALSGLPHRATEHGR